MKNKTPVLVTVLGLALLTGWAVAATTAPVPPPPPKDAPPPGGPPDEFRARIVEKLGLTADQQKILDDLRAKQRAEVQAVWDNKDLTPEIRRDKTRAIVENYRTQMRAVLTSEQQQKMVEWRGSRRDRDDRFEPGGPPAAGWGKHHAKAMQPQMPADPMAIIAMGERIKDQIAERLQLTDEQRDKLEHLGRAFRAQQRDAGKKHLEEMRAVLTPEQQQKVQEWRQHNRGGGPEGDRPPYLSMNELPGDLPEDLVANLPMAPAK